MKIYPTNNIRNIALLGHGASGKTTLVECMLFEAKEITRRGSVDEQNTVSDHYNVEKEKGNSVFSSLMHVSWKDSKINILDTPGNDNFVGEVISALKVADTGVMLLNAQQGVEVGTEIIWEYTHKFKTPMVFAVNHLDQEKANFDMTVEQAKNRFGNKVTVVQYPLKTGAGFNAIIDVLKMTMYKFPDGGGKPEKHSIPDEEQAKANQLHEALVETIAEYDENLMEIYFDTGSLSEEEMVGGLKLAMLNHEIFPLFCLSAIRNMGSGRLMGFLHDIAPTPGDREVLLQNGQLLKPDPNSQPSAFVFKSFSEPHLGEVSYLKVYSGTIKSGDELYNQTTEKPERISQLFLLNGKERKPINQLKAGDIGVIVKLKNTKINDTLGNKDSNLKIRSIQFPYPRIRSAISTENKRDLEKVMVGLLQIAKEDPTLIIEQSKELKQTIIHAQGQLHLQMTKYRLDKVYGVNIDFIAPKIPYRETITKMANDSYRHKKQSGGSGQFGEVHFRVEPFSEHMADPTDLNVRKKQTIDLEWGGKLLFYWCIVGGSIDAKYSNAIIKGIMNMMENGPLTGSYVRDIRVCVYDGKMHSVDSNDMAFQLAASQCFKQAFKNCNPIILEPIVDIEVLTPEEVMGDIMSDLQSRNAMIMGMDAENHYQKIKAKIPLRALFKYSSTLRALSQGRAKHTRGDVEYQAVAKEIQNELIENYKNDGVEV